MKKFLVKKEMKKTSSALWIGASLAAVLALSACSSTDEKAYVDRPVEELYNTAMDKLEAGEYTEAATEFEEVSRQHPYSQWAKKAQVMEAYAHYKGQKYDRVIASLEVFTQLHPGHPDVPYALYLTGLSYYEQLGPSSRDQQDTVDALRTFNELVRRFPNTAYATDAKQKIILLNDAMAGKVMDIGRYYLDRQGYQAALPRFQEVADRYQTTKHVEEAHYRMVECYLAMGLKEQAVQTAAVLGHNYPGSPWYSEAYNLVGGEKIPNFAAQKPESEGVGEIEGAKETVLDRLRNWNKGLRKKKVKPVSTEEAPIKDDMPSVRDEKAAEKPVKSEELAS